VIYLEISIAGMPSIYTLGVDNGVLIGDKDGLGENRLVKVDLWFDADFVLDRMDGLRLSFELLGLMLRIMARLFVIKPAINRIQVICLG